jgi:hypothetical protein
MPNADSHSHRPPTVDIAYLAHGRIEFTIASLTNLIQTTPWNRVGSLQIYTDGEDFQPIVDRLPQVARLKPVTRRLGGPVAVLNMAVEVAEADGADFVAKIDNDTMVPPGWLDYCISAADIHKVDLLGIEAWAMDPDPAIFPESIPDLVYPYGTTKGLYHCGVRPSRHVGGIGLFRTAAFANSLPRPARDGRYGFTEWQWENTQLVKAFLDPPLPVFLLDHLPFEPWVTLSRQYEAAGVQRRTWGVYPDSYSPLWQWWVGAQLRHTHTMR